MLEEKPTIHEVIVVEGKDDTKRIQEVVNADTIETIGSAINEEILDMIDHAQQVRGVIVLTDPDFSGEKIRKRIMEEVPDVKHAFISQKEGVPRKRNASLGVEHASNEAILRALKGVITPANSDIAEEISLGLLIKYGLINGNKAKQRRQRLGEILRIGYTNGKQLKKRLRLFCITESEFIQGMEQVLEEENSYGER